MDVSELDYPLPEDAIAQEPVEPRDAARLLVDRGADASPEHRAVADLPELLHPRDLLVVNDSRVRAARLQLRKPTGGAVEVLLLEPVGREWEALVRPSRRVRAGMQLSSHDGSVSVSVHQPLGEGRWRVAVEGDPDRVGEVPLPPYVHAKLADPERYQTVFARRPVAAAAPTAGLHLTEAVLARCRARGIDVATIELAVGLDTFRPVTEQHVEDHPMHTEAYVVPAATMEACKRARRVVAIGTTVVRALEATAATGTLEGRTDLFIRRGFSFQVVDVLLTNFHVPRTTLLALVDAFMGPRWRALYDVALASGYRFLSFGDAMLVERNS
ncbi:MAG TPA: tRNA preQ1(34) S-adenosylmethionine ribosyltransferase-isomerase QueA [Acidimicrobiales bacterium]|nr:tRNA preQ1(34) S-adenosylmethionine ribosyltransferase-isomerase QueA [Acidimicrobiales bacterium]